MRITYLGHSCFLLDISGLRVLIDPFLSGNPSSPIKPDDLDRIDVVLATHDHEDHLGDLIYIAKKFNAKTVGVYEFANWLSQNGVKNVVSANIGGKIKIGSEVTIKIVPAVHTCSIGTPVGYIISNNKESIYHAGDTDYMPYMRFIGLMYDLKVACLPIGGWYTMGIDEAIEAVIDLKPKYVIPMHYNTFEAIKTNVNLFKRLIGEKTTSECLILKPGESVEI